MTKKYISTYKNICYRCGRDRIVSKVWKEKIGDSVIENVEHICPDKKCQEELEQDIERQRNKRLLLEKRRRELPRRRHLKV